MKVGAQLELLQRIREPVGITEPGPGFGENHGFARQMSAGTGPARGAEFLPLVVLPHGNVDMPVSTNGDRRRPVCLDLRGNAVRVRPVRQRTNELFLGLFGEGSPEVATDVAAVGMP